jgi:hypothetical protein
LRRLSLVACLLAACPPVTPPSQALVAADAGPRITLQRDPPDAAPPDAAPPDAAPPDAAPTISGDRAEALLYVDLGDAGLPAPAAACRAMTTDKERINCLLAARYAEDPAAAALAFDLYLETGSVAGLHPEEDFDGGYRGIVHLVPALPVGARRQYLEWIVAATGDIDGVLAALRARAPNGRIRFRSGPLAFQFYESVKRKTPNAFAISWTLAFNVAGSINQKRDVVRETIFHETFHLNDQEHGNWSPGSVALGEIFDGIAAKCGTKISCLRPYSPGDTIVKGGTYYPFQPGNGVGEYAAELAIRYYREQRAVLRGEAVARPFKCGPDENRRAWELLAAEFFAGVDLVPPCK